MEVEDPRNISQKDMGPTHADPCKRDGQGDYAGQESPKFADPSKRDGQEDPNAGDESHSIPIQQEIEEGIMTESISYQNAFARAKQRENAGRTRAPDNASLTAHDRTLPNAKMELMLPCRKVPIQGTRRMGNPVPTASSGGQSQESQAPENDHSTQFCEFSIPTPMTPMMGRQR
jgi:hypothetical protein